MAQVGGKTVLRTAWSEQKPEVRYRTKKSGQSFWLLLFLNFINFFYGLNTRK